jgi:hypothetical protein
MTVWVKVATLHVPWTTGEARYDGVFDSYGEAESSFVEGMVALGVHRWRASSPRDVGFLRRVWWTGSLETGRVVAGWEPWLQPPAGECRLVTVRELCGEFFRDQA